MSESSQLTRKIFEAAARRNLHLAVAELPVAFFEGKLSGIKQDRISLTCLRSVLMKPEHKEWIGQIWARLSEATEEATGR